MTKGKHVRNHELVIPRGEVRPMTGIVTEDHEIPRVMDRHTSAIAQLRKEMGQETDRCRLREEETRRVLSDRCDRLNDRLDRQDRQIRHLWTTAMVITLYLLAWLVGWGMGAW